MEYFVLLFFGILLFRLGSFIVTYTRDRREAGNKYLTQDIAKMSSQNRNVQKSSLPRSIYFRLARWLRGRKLEDFEWAITFNESSSCLEITFHVPRRIIYVDLFFPTEMLFSLGEAWFYGPENTRVASSGIGFRRTKRHFRVRVYPAKISLQSKIEIFFTQAPNNIMYRAQPFCPRDYYGDFDIVSGALRDFQEHRYHGAIKSLQEYLTFSEANPVVNFHLARLYYFVKDLANAREFALRAAVHGLGEQGGEFYGTLVKEGWASDSDHLAELRQAGSQWILDKNHGLIVLESLKHHYLEIGQWYLKTVREIHEIRRPVAARMLSRMSFDFSDKEFLLFTACRIIRPDGSSRDLPIERFVIGDSHERNIHIATETEKTASWLLPDLSKGDLIEWCYHTLTQESYSDRDDTIHQLIIADLSHPYHPTLSGKVIFESTKGRELHSGRKNFHTDAKITESRENNNSLCTFEISRYLPIVNTNQYFENYFHNPAVACTLSDGNWPDVAQAILRHNFGDISVDDELPAPLSGFVDTSATPAEGLKQSFYWVRDKLKYASVSSALKLIGTPERTKSIVESGSADCKDKSYVLYQVCKKLGITAHIVAISSRHGLVFDELPSDQFDHVFIKAKVDDRWYYLDAASHSSVFGSCPPIYQGLETLILNNGGNLEVLEIDLPEKNRVTITETFDKIDSGRLYGSFHIAAEGNIGRLIDEHLKVQSLNSADYVQSAQTVLRNFLPSMMLESFDRISHTAHSNLFEVVGMQRRCRLSNSGSRLVGMLEWNDPTLPLGTWKSFRIDKTFVFYQPTIIEINIVLTGDLAGMISDISDPFVLVNDLCEIGAETIKNGEDLVLKRHVTIKKKYVESESLVQVPDVMENIERLFQTSIIFES